MPSLLDPTPGDADDGFPPGAPGHAPPGGRPEGLHDTATHVEKHASSANEASTLRGDGGSARNASPSKPAAASKVGGRKEEPAGKDAPEAGRSDSDDMNASGGATVTLETQSGDVYEGTVLDGKPHGHGRMKNKKGGVYEGAWKDGKCHGKGKLEYSSGNVYEGEWENGKRHGRGTLVLCDGRVYEGEFKDGKSTGQGTFKYGDGGVYDGAWKDNKRHGQGTMIFASGNVYNGEWKDDKPHGTGKGTWANGDVYEGGWEDGKKHGAGVFTEASSGVRYKKSYDHGELKSCERLADVVDEVGARGTSASATLAASETKAPPNAGGGNECLVRTKRGRSPESAKGGDDCKKAWPDPRPSPPLRGNKEMPPSAAAAGDFSFGGGGDDELVANKEAPGLDATPDDADAEFAPGALGNASPGDQKMPSVDGEGRSNQTLLQRLKSPSKVAKRASSTNNYEGECKNGKRHGTGKYTFADGDVYDGGWKDSVMHGKGKYTWASGTVYDGEWKDGKRHGKGTLKNERGVYEGEWANGKRHGVFTKTENGVRCEERYDHGVRTSCKQLTDDDEESVGAPSIPAEAELSSQVKPQYGLEALAHSSLDVEPARTGLGYTVIDNAIALWDPRLPTGRSPKTLLPQFAVTNRSGATGETLLVAITCIEHSDCASLRNYEYHVHAASPITGVIEAWVLDPRLCDAGHSRWICLPLRQGESLTSLATTISNDGKSRLLASTSQGVSWLINIPGLQSKMVQGKSKNWMAPELRQYLSMVESKFGDCPTTNAVFLDIVKDFVAHKVDAHETFDRVKKLFRGHVGLILGFNTFLPEGYDIKMRHREPVLVGPELPGMRCSFTAPATCLMALRDEVKDATPVAELKCAECSATTSLDASANASESTGAGGVASGQATDDAAAADAHANTCIVIAGSEKDQQGAESSGSGSHAAGPQGLGDEVKDATPAVAAPATLFSAAPAAAPPAATVPKKAVTFPTPAKATADATVEDAEAAAAPKKFEHLGRTPEWQARANEGRQDFDGADVGSPSKLAAEEAADEAKRKLSPSSAVGNDGKRARSESLGSAAKRASTKTTDDAANSSGPTFSFGPISAAPAPASSTKPSVGFQIGATSESQPALASEKKGAPIPLFSLEAPLVSSGKKPAAEKKDDASDPSSKNALSFGSGTPLLPAPAGNATTPTAPGTPGFPFGAGTEKKSDAAAPSVAPGFTFGSTPAPKPAEGASTTFQFEANTEDAAPSNKPAFGGFSAGATPAKPASSHAAGSPSCSARYESSEDPSPTKSLGDVEIPSSHSLFRESLSGSGSLVPMGGKLQQDDASAHSSSSGSGSKATESPGYSSSLSLSFDSMQRRERQQQDDSSSQASPSGSSTQYSESPSSTSSSSSEESNHQRDLNAASLEDKIASLGQATSEVDLRAHRYTFNSKVSLASGRFGVIMTCVCPMTKTKYAVKLLEKESSDEDNEPLYNEVRLLSKVRDQSNILDLVDIYEKTMKSKKKKKKAAMADYLCIVTELCPGRTLAAEVEVGLEVVMNSRGLPSPLASRIVRSLFMAVRHLHSLDIVHCDIAPQNIMVVVEAGDLTSLKLIDFGCAQMHKDGDPPLTKVVGTQQYMSPEVWSSSYDRTSDIWAVGAVTYFAVCGAVPYDIADDKERQSMAEKGAYQTNTVGWERASPEAKEFINLLLQKDISDRISVSAALGHSWLLIGES